MTLNDIMEMSWDELNKMDIKQLRIATRIVGDVANKRFNRLVDLGDLGAGQARRQFEKSGGKISTRGKNINQLRNEIGRARGFIAMKTSTARGARQVMKQRQADVFGEDFAKRKDISEEKKASMSKKVEELYEKFNEKNPAAKNIIPSKSLREYIAELIKDNPDEDVDVLLEKADRYLQGEYEKTQAGAPDEYDDFDDAEYYEY